MAQLQNVGQGQQTVFGPTLASALVLVGLVFALIGIKIFGFRRRLTFDSSETSRPGSRSRSRSQVQQQPQQAPRYAAYESQVNGTDTAVHGVFRRRNLEEFESPWPSVPPAASGSSSYFTGSVPNLRFVGSASPRETRATDRPEVSYRKQTQAQRKSRLQVHSEHYEYYTAPPTRQPPSPPTQSEAIEESVPVTAPTNLPPTDPALNVQSLPTSSAQASQSLPAATTEIASQPPSDLGMPNFDHFAEKYELISVKSPTEVTRPTSLRCKNNGQYVKFDAVDDVPEILTPEDQVPELMSPDDGLEGPLSVTAVVHRGAIPKSEPETPTEAEESFPEPRDRDSAFVVEIIAGSPEVETSQQVEVPLRGSFFDGLEMPQGDQDTDFQRIRSSFVLNEADILDVDPQQMPSPSSPPGFGKGIDEDWENFENLDVVAVPEPNWALHPNSLEQVPTVENTLREASLALDNVEQVQGLFQELELLEPRLEIFEPQPPMPSVPPPPPYDPGLPYLPDYESLMQLDNARNSQNLPKYTDVMEERSKKANYVSSIEDLYAELDDTDVTRSDSGAALVNVQNFEALCEEMSVVVTPPARIPPQPAPRSLRTATLNARGDASPLACYQPEELPSSSSSDADGEEAATGVRAPPEPAKRVRFDVENLQYYQSAEVVTSSGESDEEYLPHPTPMQRSVVFATQPWDNGVPSLFGAQVSQADSDDDDEDGFGRAISQHRSMTAALRINAARGDTEA